MSNKLEVIKNQPELFKSFKEALGRGKWNTITTTPVKRRWLFIDKNRAY